MLTLDVGASGRMALAITTEAVLDAMAKETGIDRDRLTPGATLASLDISSIDVVSVLFTIEDEFGVDVPQDGIQPGWTLEQLVDHIRAAASG